jgi:hypothetical protein
MGLFDLFQSKEKKQAIAEARRVLNEAGPQLAAADQPGQALVIAESVSANTSLTALSDKERRELTDRAFSTYWESLLADDILTSDEEEQFLKVSETLGLDVGEVDSRHPNLLSRLVVAKVNDGRLSEISEPHIIRKRGEVVHLELAAELLKEVAVREFRAGSQGLSFQVAKGVRYRVGAMRGHMVTVGTEMQVQDTGTLAVTSQRVAYLGSAKASEILFTKLMGMEVFTDGIRLQASNRQNPLLFRFIQAVSGDAVAATINAAVQRSLR